MFRKSRAWHCRFCKRRGVRWCLPHTEARKWGGSSSGQGLGHVTFPRERGPEGRASRPFPAASELKSASWWQSVPSESKLLQLGATVHFQDRAFVQRRNAQGGASVVSKEAFGVWTVAQVFGEAFCIYSHLHRQNTLEATQHRDAESPLVLPVKEEVLSLWTAGSGNICCDHFEGNLRRGGVCFDLSRHLICFLRLLLYFSKWFFILRANLVPFILLSTYNSDIAMLLMLIRHLQKSPKWYKISHLLTMP